MESLDEKRKEIANHVSVAPADRIPAVFTHGASLDIEASAHKTTELFFAAYALHREFWLLDSPCYRCNWTAVCTAKEGAVSTVQRPYMYGA